MGTMSWRAAAAGLLALVLVVGGLSGAVLGQVVPPPVPPVPPPPSLKDVPPAVPAGLAEFVLDDAAAIQLGKALFWDMQVGSDGVTACATCHFHAGADSRFKNQVNPALKAGDAVFTAGGPNYTLAAADFPLHKLTDPEDANSVVLSDTNDVVSSQGVFFGDFVDVRPGYWLDFTTLLGDPVFHVGDYTTRRVEPRNTPTVINAVYNAVNFWDGRANFNFNGVNPFGPLDQNAVVFVHLNGVTAPQQVLLPFSSLASQAVGPPVDSSEMGSIGRNWAAIGRKIVNLRPLAKQKVHPQDSVLGFLSRAGKEGNQLSRRPGLNTTYDLMIESAFRPVWWNSRKVIRFETNGTKTVIDRPNRPLAANEFTQREANFSLFFGLALQMYEATLVSNDAPFDRYMDGNPNAMTVQQLEGMDIFLNRAQCVICHSGSTFTEAMNAGGGGVGVELMAAVGGMAFYDAGFTNNAVRPTGEDLGVGGTAPIINTVTGQPYPLSTTRMRLLKQAGLLPPAVALQVAVMPTGAGSPDPQRTTVDGAFKVPGLRNVELTGPYMHNGGMATLRQVVDFYDRGGDFATVNQDNRDPQIRPLNMTTSEKEALIAFMLALTDERVREESAPFDHPQLFVPTGLQGDHQAVPGGMLLRPDGFRIDEEVMEIPAVGAGGRRQQGLTPIGTFLDLDPFQP